MNYAEYIKALEALKKLFEGRIIAAAPAIEALAYAVLLEWIESRLSIKGGRFETTDEAVEAIDDFSIAYMDMLTRMAPYRDSVIQFVKELPEISAVMRKYQEAAFGISWAAAHVAPVQKLVVNEIIDAYTENGLNAGFVQPVRDLIYQNVVAGTSYKEAKETLKEHIVSGKDKTGKLGKYLIQTAQQATDSYSGAINKKLMNTFDYEYLQMSGSLIATSTPQCRKGINDYEGLINRDTWEKVLLPIALANGLIPGTTFENLPFNRLHWGCRHEFTPTMGRKKVEGTVRTGETKQAPKKADEKIRGARTPPVVPPVKKKGGEDFGKPDEWVTLHQFENGGFVKVHISISPDESDYLNKVDCGIFFGEEGRKVYLMPDIKDNNSADYKRLFGKLIGTTYERKCPDLRVDKLFYEHEGYESSQNALRNMLNRGLKQSSRIILEDEGSTENHIRKVIFMRLKEGQSIDEVWQRKTNGALINLYINENPTE